LEAKLYDFFGVEAPTLTRKYVTASYTSTTVVLKLFHHQV